MRKPKSTPLSNMRGHRAIAKELRSLACVKSFSEEMRAVFLATSVSILTDEPLKRFLPPDIENRDGWLSTADIGKIYDMPIGAVDGVLNMLGMYGPKDYKCEFSRAIWTKSESSDKQVISYLYNPAVVLPKLKEALTPPAEDPPAS